MKYLKRFNESLDIKEAIYDIEDVLVDLDDLNLYKKREIQYKVYNNEKKLTVEFWKNSTQGEAKSWIGITDFNQLLPVIEKLIRVMNTYTNDLNLIMTYYVVNSKGSDFVEKTVEDKYRDGLTFNDTWFYNYLHRKKIALFSIEFKI